jgi:2-ketoarginine methyltransferase
MGAAVFDSRIDASFEQRLIEAIRPIREHFLASALHHLFATGLYDALARKPDGQSIDGLAGDLGMEPARLRGFLLYLANEGVVEVIDGAARATRKGLDYGEFRPWYTMMIGGYTSTLEQIGGALARDADACTRNGRYVGLGSCEISRFDGMPMTRTLLQLGDVDCREILDLGCGNALYLVELCKGLPGVRAWGCEPSPGGFGEAKRLIAASGMSERVQVANITATDFLRSPPADVLHEILAQEGEAAILSLLHNLVERFPRINIVVIEVANEIENPAQMRHGLGRNFWNPYFLLHYFTMQRLEKRTYWESLFRVAGLDVVAFTSTDPRIDSTGMELGYLLRWSASD